MGWKIAFPLHGMRVGRRMLAGTVVVDVYGPTRNVGEDRVGVRSTDLTCPHAGNIITITGIPLAL